MENIVHKKRYWKIVLVDSVSLSNSYLIQLSYLSNILTAGASPQENLTRQDSSDTNNLVSSLTHDSSPSTRSDPSNNPGIRSESPLAAAAVAAAPPASSVKNEVSSSTTSPPVPIPVQSQASEEISQQQQAKVKRKSSRLREKRSGHQGSQSSGYTHYQQNQQHNQLPVKEALSPSVAESLRAVFAAFVWHEGIVHDAMAVASYLKFHPNLSKHGTEPSAQGMLIFKKQYERTCHMFPDKLIKRFLVLDASE